MAKNKQPEPKEPQFDQSIYDVPIDRYLIDYVSSSKNMPVDDDFFTSPKAHAISLRSAGWTDREIACGLGVSRATVATWADSDALYKSCLDFIKSIETDDAEQVLWRKIITDDNANIERMFGLKARKPEYKDNAQLPTSQSVNLRITLDGLPFDTSANVKPMLMLDDGELD